ncbi:MAG: hypothetical protein JWR50_2711 [Mucilaginibacter sp.]|nr:hypothetical protein [Mucilaginibacter sp.]
MSTGGTSVEHITDVKCIGDGSANSVQETVAQVIGYLASYNYYVSVGGYTIDVTKSRSASGHEYIKTKPDSTQKDNLLSLPRFY